VFTPLCICFQGFETRGTYVRASASAASNLLEHPGGEYSFMPNIKLALGNLTDWYNKAKHSNISAGSLDISVFLNLVQAKGCRNGGPDKDQRHKRKASPESNRRQPTSSYDDPADMPGSRSECSIYFQRGKCQFELAIQLNSISFIELQIREVVLGVTGDKIR